MDLNLPPPKKKTVSGHNRLSLPRDNRFRSAYRAFGLRLTRDPALGLFMETSDEQKFVFIILKAHFIAKRINHNSLLSAGYNWSFP